MTSFAIYSAVSFGIIPDMLDEYFGLQTDERFRDSLNVFGFEAPIGTGMVLRGTFETYPNRLILFGNPEGLSENPLIISPHLHWQSIRFPLIKLMWEMTMKPRSLSGKEIEELKRLGILKS